MKYDILTSSAPKMPNLGRGAEIIKLLLSQVSKDMHEPLVPMFSPRWLHTSAAQNFFIPTTLTKNCAE